MAKKRAAASSPDKAATSSSKQGQNSTKLLPGDSDLMRGWAMDPDRASAHDVRSVETRDDLAALDLPDETVDWWAHLLPGIAYPWKMNGRTVWQFAPHKRDEHKYLFPKGTEVPLDCLRDNGGPILLVEGTKQHHAADAWSASEFAVYGMNGCWGWTKTDLSFMAGRQVYAIFDGDVRTNRDVHDSAGALRDTLKPADAKVRFVLLPGPGNQGLDDFLAKIGDPAERRKQLANLINDATDELGRAPARKRKPKPSEFFDEAGNIKPWDVAKHINRDSPLLLTREHRAAVYRNGVYVVNELALVGALVKLLKNEYKRAYLGTVEDTVLSMLDEMGRHLPDHIDGPWMNCLNGMVDLETGELHPHDPELRSAVQFPIAYDPKATCPTFDDWAERIIGAQLDDLLEVMSTMLDPTWSPTRAAFLFGPSKTGKSTFLRLMAAVVGPEHTTGVTLQELAEDQFARANLYGKVLNVAADLPARHVRDVAWFKAMTGEDLIRGNRKYGKDFPFVNTALFAFSANEIPTVGEASDAYVNRIKPFKFGNSYAGREDPSIEAAMMEELPGILNRLVDAYRRRKARGKWLETDLPTMAEFEDASDRVKLWLREEMQIVTEYKGQPVIHDQTLPLELTSTQKTLGRLFGEWAALTRSPSMGATKLGQRLRLIPGVQVVRQGTSFQRALNIIERSAQPWDDPPPLAKLAENRPVSMNSQADDVTSRSASDQKFVESGQESASFASDLPESVLCPRPGVTGSTVSRGPRKGLCPRTAERMDTKSGVFYRCPTHGAIPAEEVSST